MDSTPNARHARTLLSIKSTYKIVALERDCDGALGLLHKCCVSQMSLTQASFKDVPSHAEADLLGLWQVAGSEQESSRLLLCHATAVIMRQVLRLLGITPLNRI